MPKISATELEALEAGTVWWDGELFSGKPDWKKILGTKLPHLSEEEENFLNGPVEKLCSMIDNWQINFVLKDLPVEIWQFLKQEKFFGLMIPKKYGGLEFSALAHSDILAKIAGKSITVASTVSVPNSLGPAELLLRYGTEDQKDYYLPRLANGSEIPCFALTSPEAGSDATSIIDHGVVCKREFDGKVTLGILLNWNKRYITLAPIATVMGLAFKLFDPQLLLGKETDIGITCALIPTNTPGVIIGDRHWPLMAMFQNGPTHGKDVFIPLDWIIGGKTMAGKGWKMLVESLSCGRAISLPSVTAGKARTNAALTGAYASIRKQFGQPIGYFEGIEEPLARIAANTYICNATRRITAASIDLGQQPTVAGAISKYQVTERTRQISIDAMDIHGGKGIMQGPKNYIADAYINAPVAITVEGANILTRSMIIFGQGAIRCHPYIMQELTAIQDPDPEQAKIKFDHAFTEHMLYSISNCILAFSGYMTRGRLRHAPIKHETKKYYQFISWASSAFAFLADTSLIVIGGKLKYKEKLSARLADLLALLYLSTVCLKKFEDEGRQAQDIPLLQWCLNDLLHNFWNTALDIINNFPNKIIAILLKILILPLGNPIKKPNDKQGQEIAKMLLQPNPSRDRLLAGAYTQGLDDALNQVLAARELEKRVAAAVKEGVITASSAEEQINTALNLKLINQQEAETLRLAHAARAEAIAVDFFNQKTWPK